MRKEPTLAFALAFALFAIGCGGGGGEGSTLGPVPTSEPTGNASPTPAPVTSATAGASAGSDSSATPTTTPVTGSVTEGTASLVVSGDLQTAQPTIPLASPAIYALPPGSFALDWQAAAVGVSLAGPTFIGTKPTSDVMRLSFFVHASSGTYQFVSTYGGCSVTVALADPTTFSGTFACETVTDAGGTVTVGAQGAFLASG